jgi:hypothetical protein
MGTTTSLEVARGELPAAPPPDRVLAAGLVALAAGLAVAALLGPLVAGVIRYPVSETLESQAIGLDVVSLVVVAPLALVAAWWARRGREAGAALALGIGAYTSYMAIQYVVGPEYLARAGNSERAFPLFLALFVLGWAIAVLAWSRVGEAGASTRRERTLGRRALPALAFLAFVRYLPALVDAAADTPEDAGYLAGPTFFWTIALLDLGVFLPATVAACWGLVRGTAWRARALYLVTGWFGLVGPAVAAMGVAMYVRDDPNASLAGTVFMAVLGAAFAALALVVYLPLLRRRVP